MGRLAFARSLSMCLAAGALCALAALGCGSSSSGGQGGSASAGPDVPVLTDVMAMDGGLHVSWTIGGSCEQVEAERKSSMDPYAVAFTKPGADLSYLDMDATDDMMYTYRLRCKTGDTYSEYSDEKSGNPKAM